MSAIIIARSLRTAKFIQRSLPLISSNRFCGHLKYWRPGPPPKTKEEHEAAARKYNMIPEDYKPHPEDENWGDYPDLPWASVESRDPYEPWDYYYSRRSYGEPLNIYHLHQMAHVHDPNREYQFPTWVMFATFFGFIGSIAFLMFIESYFDLRFNHARKPKQYPGPGKIHYTFEPAE